MKYMSDIIIHFYTGGVLLQTNQKPEEENEPEENSFINLIVCIICHKYD